MTVDFVLPFLPVVLRSRLDWTLLYIGGILPIFHWEEGAEGADRWIYPWGAMFFWGGGENWLDEGENRGLI